MPESPHVKVTLEVIYRELSNLKSVVMGLPAEVRDHETRIRAIEKAMWSAAGLGGVVGGVAVAVINYFIEH